MDEVKIEYRELKQVALIKILELADLLNCTPKEAAKAWMLFQAERAKREGRVLEMIEG